jgi:CheY-like chemotaxis protein
VQTILVIEDNPQARQLFCWALEKAGYRALGAGDGREGLAAFRSARPDLVVCDLFMPEMDGLGFLLELRKHHPGAKVVAISGGGRDAPGDFLHAAMLLGAVAALSKPVETEELLGAVRAALAG